jgi:hypothetical protein
LTVGEPSAIQPALNNFFRNEGASTALEVVLAYVQRYRHQGAALVPLYPERALTVLGENYTSFAGPAAWQLAVPDLRSRRTALGAYHYLRLAPERFLPGGENAYVKNLLNSASLLGDRTVTYVHSPEINTPRRLPQDKADFRRRQWGLETCGFPEVWRCFEAGENPGPIAIVDFGGDKNHPDLRPAITKVVQPNGNATVSDHASKVAGVLAARQGVCEMLGCCWAQLHLYNVSVEDRLDCFAYYSALKAIAEDREVRVVNLSLESDLDDRLIADQVHECICEGKILVAAMGNTGAAAPVYPSAYPGVIAVGAINQSYRKYSLSSVGKHILLSAPGDWILSVDGSGSCDKRNSGTSFAAPMVSAAVWLALRVRPASGLPEIRKLLAASVLGNGVHSPELGWGVLNMHRMVEVLSISRREQLGGTG